MMKLFLWLCVLTLPNYCLLETNRQSGTSSIELGYPRDRKEPPSGRIIGGEEVIPHSYPFQVGYYVYLGNGLRFFCGGTLISTEWVLTAAHCLDGNITNIRVFMASHNVREPYEPRRVIMETTVYVYHYNWTDNFHDDIGLIKLPQKVILSEFISLVRYAKGSDTYAERTGTMVGWGLTENTTNISPVLRSVESRILTNEECKARPPFSEVVIPTHICVSGTGPVGTCNGDSGGPLLVDGVQVGITAFGTTNCTLQYPSVFTRITEYELWIAQYVADGDGVDTCNRLHYSIAISAAVCLYQFLVYV